MISYIELLFHSCVHNMTSRNTCWSKRVQKQREKGTREHLHPDYIYKQYLKHSHRTWPITQSIPLATFPALLSSQLVGQCFGGVTLNFQLQNQLLFSWPNSTAISFHILFTNLKQTGKSCIHPFSKHIYISAKHLHATQPPGSSAKNAWEEIQFDNPAARPVSLPRAKISSPQRFLECLRIEEGTPTSNR